MEIRNVSSTAVNRPTASSSPEAVAGTADPATSATTETKSTGAGGYISPFLRYDQGARVAVLLFRDVDTGETQDQIPSQRVVEEYRRAAGRTPASTTQKGTSSTRDPGQASTGDPTGSAAKSDSASSVGAVPVERGISFASFGSSSTAAAAASFGSGSGAPTTSAPAAPIGGGSFGSAPGGLVSVTV